MMDGTTLRRLRSWTQSRRATASSAGNPCKIFGSHIRSCRCTSHRLLSASSTTIYLHLLCSCSPLRNRSSLTRHRSSHIRSSRFYRGNRSQSSRLLLLLRGNRCRCLVNRRLCHLSHFHSSRQAEMRGHRTRRCDSSCSLVLLLYSWVVDHLRCLPPPRQVR